MILDPINSVTSVSFYKKVAKQTTLRSFGYLAYLSFLFAVAATFAVHVKVRPLIDETFDWLAKSMPPLTFSEGKVTSPATAAVVLRHPRVAEVAVVVDTTRAEPVTPQMLEENKAVAYLASNAFYLLQRPGKLEIYDFSKATNPKPIVVDAEFFRNANRAIGTFLYPMALVFGFFFFFFWKAFASLLYSLLALVVNGLADAKLEYKALFNIAVYAQTLVVILQAMFLFLPQKPSIFVPIAWIIIGVYLWLGINTNKEQPPTAA